jgi:hypothetical protein
MKPQSPVMADAPRAYRSNHKNAVEKRGEHQESSGKKWGYNTNIVGIMGIMNLKE